MQIGHSSAKLVPWLKSWELPKSHTHSVSALESSIQGIDFRQPGRLCNIPDVSPLLGCKLNACLFCLQHRDLSISAERLLLSKKCLEKAAEMWPLVYHPLWTAPQAPHCLTEMESPCLGHSAYCNRRQQGLGETRALIITTTWKYKYVKQRTSSK